MEEDDAFGIKETIEASANMINSLSTTYDFTRVSMVPCIQVFGIWGHVNYQGGYFNKALKEQFIHIEMKQ